MTLVIVLGMLGVLSLVCSANDAYIGFSGGAAKLMDDHPSISMTDEHVRVDIFKDSYTVRASFNFSNDGKETRVSVGFPVRGSKPQAILKFNTWVDGKKVTTENSPLDPKPDDEGNYSYWKIKSVVFPAKINISSIVEFSAPLGDSSIGHHFVDYVYGTGKSWRGSIARAVFDFRFNEENRIDRASYGIYNSTYVFSIAHRAKGQIVYEVKDLEPTSEWDSIHFSFCPSEPDWNQERRRCHEWLDRAERYREDLGDLRELSLGDLRILRNMVFARRGKVFKDPELQKLFEATSWYKPNEANDPENISVDEKNLVERLSKQEALIRSAAPYQE